jgi:hypothetical protein
MANFKVGDRVRKVQIYGAGFEPIPIGATGTIAGVQTVSLWEYEVRYDGFGEVCVADAFMIAPLTDPRAQEFIEDMERFSRVTKPTRVIAA